MFRHFKRYDTQMCSMFSFLCSSWHTLLYVTMHISMVFECFSNWWGNSCVCMYVWVCLCLACLCCFFMPHHLLMYTSARMKENSSASFCFAIAAASSAATVVRTIWCAVIFDVITIRARVITWRFMVRFGRKSAIASDGFSYDADAERTAIK